jgi:hypothetical protein
MLNYLKGILSPFCFSSKKYQILSGILPKGQFTKLEKICKKGIARGNQISSCSLQKGLCLPLEQLQKVIKLPLEQCWIHELHATPTILA